MFKTILLPCFGQKCHHYKLPQDGGCSEGSNPSGMSAKPTQHGLELKSTDSFLTFKAAREVQPEYKFYCAYS